MASHSIYTIQIHWQYNHSSGLTMRDHHITKNHFGSKIKARWHTQRGNVRSSAEEIVIGLPSEMAGSLCLMVVLYSFIYIKFIH